MQSWHRPWNSEPCRWFVWDDPNLTTIAKALIEDPARQKLVSVASCWEIAIKVGLKKIALGEPAASFLPRELATNGFGLLEIKLIHATFIASSAMQSRHRLRDSERCQAFRFTKRRPDWQS
jgi:PIN domain nuclease of toxin-antitoxin system